MNIYDPTICNLEETYFRPNEMIRLKVKKWKKIFHGNCNEKRAGTNSD